MVDIAPPPGFSYLSHSLRHGMASAAAAIEVAFHKIRHLGGWAAGSTVINDYIDPNVLADRGAYEFFGFLLGVNQRNMATST